MYLYIYKNEKRLTTEKVRDVLRDYNEKEQLGFSQQEIMNLEIARGKYGKPYFRQLAVPQNRQDSISGILPDAIWKTSSTDIPKNGGTGSENAPEAIRFSGTGKENAPEAIRLSGTGSENASEAIRFSISHSGNWWACLIGFHEMGLDIEDLEKGRMRMADSKVNQKRGEAIAKRFFTKEEYEYVLAQGTPAFYKIWTRKEAYTKYLGTGIGQGLDTFHVFGQNQFVDQIGRVLVRELDLKGRGLPKAIEDIKGAYCTEGDEIIEHIIVE
ncbi:MAG: 4'-phosphopantetheinyl transferase superfamily protein [Anaerovorax sp.]